MKRYILFILLIISVTNAYAQREFYFREGKKPLTFQVSAGALDYDGLKYGWSIGANVKETFSFSYFHARDYVSTENSWADSRLAGFHGNFLLPASDCVRVGGGIRFASLNEGMNHEWQKPIYTVESQMDLNECLKLSFEYGGSKQQSFGTVRLVFNIY